jgi:hypothetical protein
MLSCSNQEYRLLIVKSSLGHELLVLNTSRWIVTERNDCSTSLVSSLIVFLSVSQIIGTLTDKLLCNSSLPAFSFKPVLLNRLPRQLHCNFYFGSASNMCHSDQEITLEARNWTEIKIRAFFVYILMEHIVNNLHQPLLWHKTWLSETITGRIGFHEWTVQHVSLLFDAEMVV